MLIARMYDHAIIYNLEDGKAECLKIITMKGYHDLSGVALSSENQDVVVVLYGKYMSEGKVMTVQEFNLQEKTWTTLRKFKDTGYSNQLSASGKFL